MSLEAIDPHLRPVRAKTASEAVEYGRSLFGLPPVPAEAQGKYGRYLSHGTRQA